MSGSFRNKLRLIDDRLLNDQVPRRILSIGFRPDGFVFCVMDVDQFRFMALEQYTFDHQPAEDEFFQLFSSFKQTHPILGMSFEKVSLSYFSPNLVLIPEALYKPGDETGLFDASTKMPPAGQLMTDSLNILRARGVYMVPAWLTDLGDQFGCDYLIKHDGSVLIENILASQRLENWQADLVLHVKPTQCDIIVLHGEDLKYYQTFSIQAFEDVIYYLFFVVNEFGLDSTSLKIVLLGDVGMDTAEYAMLSGLFREVAIPRRNDVFHYSQVFDQLPYHFHYNLFNMVTCGS